MIDYKNYLIEAGATIKQALEQLNSVAQDSILFVVNAEQKLVGSLTDGDVRRGLIKGLETKDKVEAFMQSQPRSIQHGNYSIDDVRNLRKGHFKLVPVLDESGRIVKIINFRVLKSYLPLDAVIMAGGRGSRLRPLTDTIPKPLLKIGDKAIMEHNLDRLQKFGVDDFWFSVRYKGSMIRDHFKDGQDREINIKYIWEDEPLGTIGAVSQIDDFKHDYVLVTNSDLLTTLDYEDFFYDFIEHGADMAVATIPYTVDVPYAVMETEDNYVKSFKEKPTYTYYSNAGIYLLKRELLDMIPANTFFNSTDLMEDVIKKGLKLRSYPLRHYWLDIGKHEDFEKAKSDIKYLDL